MKLFTILAFCCCVAIGNIQAQKTAAVSSSTQSSVSSDQSVKAFMQHLTQTYNLNSDQQLSVKKAGIAFAENVRNAGKVNDKQKNNLVAAFNSTIMVILSQSQQEHYQQAGQITDPMIDAIINAAMSK